MPALAVCVARRVMFGVVGIAPKTTPKQELAR